jgi:hypothetical protein
MFGGLLSYGFLDEIGLANSYDVYKGEINGHEALFSQGTGFMNSNNQQVSFYDADRKTLITLSNWSPDPLAAPREVCNWPVLITQDSSARREYTFSPYLRYQGYDKSSHPGLAEYTFQAPDACITPQQQEWLIGMANQIMKELHKPEYLIKTEKSTVDHS